MRQIVLMDGAVGTSLWEKTTDKVAVWRYNIENPAIVAELADEYVRAGAQIVLANTFAANATSMRGTSYQVHDVVSRAMAIAREAVAGRAKIVLSVGPLNDLLEPYGNLTYEDARSAFDEQIDAGVAGKPDLIYIQTFMDLEMMKLALASANRHDLPVLCSFSFDKKGRTMMGNSVSDVVEGVKPYRVNAIGLNCSIGPDLALPVLEQFTHCTDLPLVFKPNAGKPILDASGQGAEFDADAFANDVTQALDIGATYIGGCCGSNPRYIAKMAQKARAWQDAHRND